MEFDAALDDQEAFVVDEAEVAEEVEADDGLVVDEGLADLHAVVEGEAVVGEVEVQQRGVVLERLQEVDDVENDVSHVHVFFSLVSITNEANAQK